MRRRMSSGTAEIRARAALAGSGTAVRLKFVIVPTAARLSPNWMSEIPPVSPVSVTGEPVARKPFIYQLSVPLVELVGV